MRKVGIIGILMLTVIIMLASCTKNESGVMLYIGSEKVETDEFMMFASGHKAQTVQYFTNKYNAEYTEGFWTKDFDGQTPWEYLSNEVIKELTEIKMLQKLAKKEGVLKSAGYSDLIKTMNKTNEQRKQQKMNQEVVYGVTKYSPYEYYSDSMAKLKIKLKQKMTENTEPNEEKLRGFYEEIKDTYYKKSNETNITVYKFPLEEEETAAKLLEKAKIGEDISAEAAKAGAASESMDIDYTSDRYISLYYPGLSQLIAEKTMPAAAGLYRTAEEVSFVKVNEIKDGGYKPFEDVESNVLSMYMDKLIDEKVKEMAENAEIKYTDEYENPDFDKL